ncbi:MAG: hypothetical protein LBK95_01465 [Bifidobacteriaceae bacterium]|jgi:hypothetical protein|nr:hypothetical protein [Bifidobacteriaceae bacterium]
MDLYKIHELIADRTADGWYVLKSQGPLFDYRWTYGSGPDGEFSHIESEHRSRAVCREEPSLTVSWGMDVHSRKDARELTFDWAKTFVNPAVDPFWVDFFWNGGLIDRVELFSIDGGHGTIPAMGSRLEVTDFEEAVAWLIHGLDGSPNEDDPGRYLDLLGATRVRDPERHGAGSPADRP